MSKICPNSIQNMFQNFPKYVQNIWEICPNISKICPTFVHNMFQTAQNLLKIIRKNLIKCPDSVQNQLKFRSKYVKNPAKECLKYVKKCVSTYSKLLSKYFKYYYFRHCCGQQTINPALPQPSSGCRATHSM